MSADASPGSAASPIATAATAVPPPAKAVWPWPAIFIVTFFWALRFIVGYFDKPYFLGFLFIMVSAALLAVVYFAWWWASRRRSLSDRISGFVLIVGGCLIAEPTLHRSIGWFGLLAMGLPLVLTTWTVWLIVRQRCSIFWNRVGSLLVVVTSLASFTLMRIDGVDADLQADVRWRWSSSAEDMFMAEQASRSSAVTALDPSAHGERVPVLRPGDWGEFRGADRDGVIRGQRIGTDWNRAPPRLVWRQRVGPAWSSVIAVGGRLFTQEQRGEDEAVVCYDALDGRCLWTHQDTARFWESVSGAGPRATPTFADGRVYTLGGTGILNCLDAATGTRYWTRNIATDAGAGVPQWGFSSSPLLVDGLVVVFAGGDGSKSLLAYRMATGDLSWAAPAGMTSYSSPQLATLAGKRQYLQLSDDGLTSVEPPSGAVLWKYGDPWRGAPRAVQPHVLGPTQLAVGTLDGFGVSLLDVGTDGGVWRIDRRWISKDLKPEFPDFVVHKGHAYGFDVNVFCCIDLSTGKRCWKGGRYGRGQVELLSEQSLLLVAAENGEIVVLTANPREREEIGRFRALDGKTWNHPVIAQRRLYIRNAEEMACYDLASDGRER